ncbi:gp53-like domain-containing protein [Burkholderia pyrrocinia]|uniref:gp53-like domain-containing protein n=1 Tax=Burkholderia pyrrocinia TaxID=60550 RepID=UPI00158C87CA|nr:hypothetical protein [Burkholderia pyrrocinia]
MLIQDMLGTNTVFSGLACVPTSPAGMTVNVNPGRVYSLQQRDPTAYSSLGQDTTNQIMKQGILLAATNFSCPAPAMSGYSINYLISAAFLEQDTNAIVLPYYNSNNPQQAFSGPPVNGQSSGTAQNTTRQDTIQLTLTAGVAAATGSQQTPATPTGQIPLWVVTVAYGQSTITASSISAVAGSPFAPTGGYFQAVGERYSSIINASSTQTLTTAALGALVNVTATGTTQTLPAASACPNGTSITVVYMQSSGSAVVTRNGTDTLAFGQGNSANSITLSPGEEVQFVSNGANGWVSAGQTLSTGVTPPQFDNTTKLATMAAVQRALGNNNAGTRITTAGTTFTASQAGGSFTLEGASSTYNLPTIASVPSGATFEFLATVNSATVSTQSTDKMMTGSLVSATTCVLNNGDTAKFVSDGTYWVLVGGSAALRLSLGDFASSLSLSGYQKLPNGLIIQWGEMVTPGSSGTLTFPIAFPNSSLMVTGNPYNSSATAANVTFSTVGPSNKASCPYYQNTTTAIGWIAIGY